MKKFILLPLFFGLLAYVTLRLLNSPTRIIPYPYIISSTIDIPEEVELSTLLVVGDRLGKSLSFFAERIREQVFKTTDSSFTMFNWAEDGEGLHRTIAKLKSLDVYPSLVIYFGGSQEFQEKKFNLKDKKIISKNFKRYDNSILLTSIFIVPQLSKAIYLPETLTFLPKKIKTQTLELNSKNTIEFNKILFKLYQTELAELFQLATDKNFKLLVIIPPLNIDVPIRNNCLASSFTEEKKSQKHIQNLINKDLLQEAYSEALVLTDKDKTNGHNHQLLGFVLREQGKIKDAIKQLEQATIYDCDYWRGSIVMNSILETQVKSYGIPSINFHTYLLKYYNTNLLFFDSIFPQRIYYDKFILGLSKKIQGILGI